MLVDGFVVQETPCLGLDVCEAKTREIVNVPSSRMLALAWRRLGQPYQWCWTSAKICSQTFSSTLVPRWDCCSSAWLDPLAQKVSLRFLRLESSCCRSCAWSKHLEALLSVFFKVSKCFLETGVVSSWKPNSYGIFGWNPLCKKNGSMTASNPSSPVGSGVMVAWEYVRIVFFLPSFAWLVCWVATFRSSAHKLEFDAPLRVRKNAGLDQLHTNVVCA